MPLFMASIKLSAASTKAVVEKPPCGKSCPGSRRLHFEELLFCARAVRCGRHLRGTRRYYGGIGVDDPWSLACVLVSEDDPIVHHGRGDDGYDKCRRDTEDLQAALPSLRGSRIGFCAGTPAHTSFALLPGPNLPQGKSGTPRPGGGSGSIRAIGNAW